MFLALIGAALIGTTLGLLGSGGSILTVPILVYLLGKDGKIAITESLAIVGGIAAFGVIPHARKKFVQWKIAAFFGGPGMLGASFGSVIGSYLPGALQLILFAAVMLTASWFMLRRSHRDLPQPQAGSKSSQPLWIVMLEGFAVGTMTGLVGVGGGFLIVPSLVLLAGLSMHHAVATSLVVIVANSWAAFARYQFDISDAGISIDWTTIALFITVGAVGTFVGKAVGGRIDQRALKKIFAIFLIVMGLIMIARESVRLLTNPEKDQDIASTS
ncbi:MAG: sulfite exporter TauE/SafE family protein [Phycisphaera sp.]|nr:MAG: sulfite exporter TauE/SafE family protein [Phycisphaera sp.]